MTIIANVDKAPAPAMMRILLLSGNILYADKQTKPYAFASLSDIYEYNTAHYFISFIQLVLDL